MNGKGMGDDAIFSIIILFVISGVILYAHIRRWQKVARLGYPPWQRLPLYLAPPISVGLLYVILVSFAAGEVRAGGEDLVLFMAAGALWSVCIPGLCGCFGVDLRADALENHNGAAIITLTGAIIGGMLAYAGGNIGEGNADWMTFFSIGIAIVGLATAWSLLDCISQVSRSVSVERDLAAGWRLAGFLVASGLILGRAVAGNWESTTGTLIDFAKFGWPELVLLAVAAAAERFWRPTVAKKPSPVGTGGILPAAFYIFIAVVTLLWEGKWK